MWPRLKYSCQGLALALLLAPLTTAYAKNAASSDEAIKFQAGSLYHMIICRESGTFDLDVNWRTGTLIQVPGGIKDRAWPKIPGFTFRDKKKAHKVYFSPDQGTPAGAETSLRVWLSSGHEATIHAKAVDHTQGIEANVLLYHQSEREKLGFADEPNPCEPGYDSMRALEFRAHERNGVKHHERAIPEIGQVARSGDGLDVSLPLSEWGQDHLVVDFEARNPAFQPSMLSDIRVLDQHGEPMTAKLIYEDKRTSDDTIETIGPRQSMRASILLPNAAKRDIEPMWFEFHGTIGASKYVTTIKVIRMRPVSEEETERDQRAKQVAVSVRGLYGGFWTNPGEDLGGLDGTSVAGLGVRVTKGISPLFAFEGEFVGGRTGDATFAGVDWGGMQGNVTRRATLGRLLATAVIRFGDRYVVSTRAGLGVQLASYDSLMDTGGSTMDGPGDGFEVDGLWTVGAGFDARLGDRWLLGVTATFASTFYSGPRSLEGGIHLGYGWGGSDNK